MGRNRLMKGKKKDVIKSLVLCLLVVGIVFSQLILEVTASEESDEDGTTVKTEDNETTGNNEDNGTTESDVNIALGKKATASESNSAYETADKAINGDMDDKWCTGWTSERKWLELDLGGMYEINRWEVYHAGISEYSEYNTRDFTLQYSEDGYNWSIADAVKNNKEDITKRDTRTFMARYVKLSVEYSDQVSNSCARIYEFKLFHIQKENIALNKTVTASEYVNNRETPDKAVNGTYSNYADKWCTGWSNEPKWLQVDLGETYTIKRFKIIHAGAVEQGYPEYNTKNFSIEKSSDGVNWEGVYAVIGNRSSLTEEVFSPVSARYVRLKIEQSQQNDDGCARIYEFQLFSN